MVRMYYSKFLVIFLILVFKTFQYNALLYPAATVLQLIGSLSVPIYDLTNDRKVLFDWGFQMNYDMPFNLSSSYMTPIWPQRSISAIIHEDFVMKRDLKILLNQKYFINEKYIDNYTIEELFIHIETLMNKILTQQRNNFMLKNRTLFSNTTSLNDNCQPLSSLNCIDRIFNYF